MKHLLENYQALLNLPEATFSKIDHEDAMVAVVYRVTKANGEQLILKICDRENDYLRELHFLNYFKEILPVPKVIQALPSTLNQHAAILMECLPGSLLKTAELTEALAYEIGNCLAKIHLNRLQGYGDPVQGNLSMDPKAYFSLKFEEGLQECKSHLPKELIEKCQQYYAAHIDLLNSVDGPCIVHRDFRPGNLIVYQGKLRGVIDWAGARASFAEEDLFSLEHGEWPINSDCKKAFLAGYSNVRKIPDYTRVIPLLRLNKAIATIGFTVKRETWDGRDSSIYRYNRQFLDSLSILE